MMNKNMRMLENVNEEMENELMKYYIDYLMWYFNKGKDLNYGKTDNESIINFFLMNIGKPKSIENSLDNIECIMLINEYLDKYRKKIEIFNECYEFNYVSYNNYRTEEQRNEIIRITNNINNKIEYYRTDKDRKFIELLEKKKANYDHIDKVTAQKFIEWYMKEEGLN